MISMRMPWAVLDTDRLAGMAATSTSRGRSWTTSGAHERIRPRILPLSGDLPVVKGRRHWQHEDIELAA